MDKPCIENPLWGFNETAKNQQCLIVVSRFDMKKSEVHYAKGLPRVSTTPCVGGANVTVEFFVPTVRRVAPSSIRSGDRRQRNGVA